jgi:hypothetical protein
MSMTDEQKGVAKGAATAMAITVIGLAGAIVLLGPKSAGISVTGRLALCASCLLAPALTLAFSIARLAGYRFSSPQDIGGSGLTSGSRTAVLLQSLLQNTLEQTVLAGLTYVAWGVLAPASFLAALPAAATMFLIGRVLFFIGYAHGAQARSLGFALTFYPTLALLLGDLGFIVLEIMALIRGG